MVTDPNDPARCPFLCGASGQPACPPPPAMLNGAEPSDPTAPLYSYNEMLAHGYAQYHKGREEGN